LNVDRGVFSADCVRPAPEMADVSLARISSTLSSYSNRAPGMHKAAYTKDEADVPVYVTEAVENKDPRSNGPEFSAAKQKELPGLLERGTFKVVLREEIPKNAPVMTGRFVLVIKIARLTKRYTKRVMSCRVFLIHSSNALCIIHLT
jgi:hypothetical protein